MQVGTLPHEPLPFVVNELMAKELDLRGAFRWGIEFDWAVDYLASRRVDVRPLLSGQYPLQDAVAAFAAAADKNKSTKVQVVAAGRHPSLTGSIHARYAHNGGDIMHLLSKLALAAVAVTALAAGAPALAQQKLKWAHVYETSEPYHTESVWAAAEIKKRTNGKFDIEVFPASTLGKETDINQGMTLGTVDMIISGPSFAARSYPRLGIAYYPFIFRDADHLLAYSKSPIFAEMVEEFRKKTGIQILAYTYYGARQTTAQKPFTDCAGHEGPQDPRAGRPGVHGDAEGLRRQPDADRVRRGLSRAAERHRRRAGKPADDDRGQEVLRGAEGDHDDVAHRRRPDDPGRAARVEQADAIRKSRSSPKSRAKRRRGRRRRSRSARPSSPTSSRRRGCRSSRSTARASSTRC